MIHRIPCARTRMTEIQNHSFEENAVEAFKIAFTNFPSIDRTLVFIPRTMSGYFETLENTWM